jgi:hypothetical protein
MERNSRSRWQLGLNYEIMIPILLRVRKYVRSYFVLCFILKLKAFGLTYFSPKKVQSYIFYVNTISITLAAIRA